jgi:hypothetical protein
MNAPIIGPWPHLSGAHVDNRKAMSRYRTLLSLGAVILVVAVASLIATGALRRAPAAPRATPTLLVTPSPFPVLPIPPFPTPPSCTTNQLELVGVFNECAVGATKGTASYCSVSGTTLSDVLHLQGKTHGYLLYLTIVGYRGSGVTYVNASVLVREYVTGALWQSTKGGIIRVTGADGRSGTVKADLAYSGGAPTPPTVGLNVSGTWGCA